MWADILIGLIVAVALICFTLGALIPLFTDA
jgi:hypothetical protein